MDIGDEAGVDVEMTESCFCRREFLPCGACNGAEEEICFMSGEHEVGDSFVGTKCCEGRKRVKRWWW